MKITIAYMCPDCGDVFSGYCGVPDELDNQTIRHACAGASRCVGADGASLAYACDACGHVTRADITSMIPAMASRTHGCGRECGPA